MARELDLGRFPPPEKRPLNAETAPAPLAAFPFDCERIDDIEDAYGCNDSGLPGRSDVGEETGVPNMPWARIESITSRSPRGSTTPTPEELECCPRPARAALPGGKK